MVVVLPVDTNVDTNDTSRITTSTRTIAIDSLNDNSLSGSYGGYCTSVDAIEQSAGVDLLSAVLASVRGVLEARGDTSPTQ